MQHSKFYGNKHNVGHNHQLSFNFQTGTENSSGQHSRKANGSAGNTGVLGRFTSLRGGGKSLGKTVRERLSSSLYSSSSSGRSHQQQEAESSLMPSVTEVKKNNNKPVTHMDKGKQNKARSKLCALL